MIQETFVKDKGLIGDIFNELKIYSFPVYLLAVNE